MLSIYHPAELLIVASKVVVMVVWGLWFSTGMPAFPYMAQCMAGLGRLLAHCAASPYLWCDAGEISSLSCACGAMQADIPGDP